MEANEIKTLEFLLTDEEMKVAIKDYEYCKFLLKSKILTEAQVKILLEYITKGMNNDPVVLLPPLYFMNILDCLIDNYELSQRDISKIIEASSWSNLSIKLAKLKLSEENQLAFWDKGHRLLLAHLVSHQLFSESVFNKIFSDLSTFDYKDREYLIKYLSTNNNLSDRQRRLLLLS